MIWTNYEFDTKLNYDSALFSIRKLMYDQKELVRVLGGMLQRYALDFSGELERSIHRWQTLLPTTALTLVLAWHRTSLVWRKKGNL